MKNKNLKNPPTWSFIIIGVVLIFLAFGYDSGFNSILLIAGFGLLSFGIVNLVYIKKESKNIEKKEKKSEVKAYHQAFLKVAFWFSVLLTLFLLVVSLTNPELRDDPGIPTLVLFSFGFGMLSYIVIKIIVKATEKIRGDA